MPEFFRLLDGDGEALLPGGDIPAGRGNEHLIGGNIGGFIAVHQAVVLDYQVGHIGGRGEGGVKGEAVSRLDGKRQAAWLNFNAIGSLYAAGDEQGCKKDQDGQRQRQDGEQAPGFRIFVGRWKV